MKTRAQFVLAFLLLSGISFAQSTDSLLVEIKMKDGSLQKGRIVEQLPGPHAIMETVDGKRIVVGRSNSENLELDLEYLEEALMAERNSQSNSGSGILLNPYTSFRFGYGTGTQSIIINIYENIDASIRYLEVNVYPNYNFPVFSFEPVFNFNEVFAAYVGISMSNSESEDNYRRNVTNRVITTDSVITSPQTSIGSIVKSRNVILNGGIRVSPVFSKMPVTPYLSVGFIKNFAKYEYEEKYIPPVNSTVKTNLPEVLERLNAYSGLEFSVGANYQFNNYIGFFGEYKVQLIGAEATLESTNTTTTNQYINNEWVWVNQTVNESNEIKYSYWIDKAQIGLIFYFR